MIHRARAVLEAVGRAYPGAWATIDSFRAQRGKELPDWPEWCYAPMYGAYYVAVGIRLNGDGSGATPRTILGG